MPGLFIGSAVLYTDMGLILSHCYVLAPPHWGICDAVKSMFYLFIYLVKKLFFAQYKQKIDSHG